MPKVINMKLILYNLPVILLTTFIILLSSCKNDACESVDRVETDLSVEPLHEILVKATSPGDIISFGENYPFVANEFLQRSEYPSDSIWAGRVFGLFNDPNFDSLLIETNRVFNNLSALENQLKRAFGRIKYFYPDFSPPKVYTMITGFANDMIVTDSVIIIGLDFYLGQGAKYRPLHFPEYIQATYHPDAIVPSIVLLLSKQFNQVLSDDHTMLADMVFYGKSYYFSKQVLPCAPDYALINYSAAQVQDVNENEDVIWSFFLQNELLFSTSDVDKKKFLSDRPYIPEIGEKCPGRVGAWLGWQLVSDYADKQNMGLVKLMSETDARKILKGSGFRPK